MQAALRSAALAARPTAATRAQRRLPIAMPSVSTSLLLGGIPSSSPVCTPRATMWLTTWSACATWILISCFDPGAATRPPPLLGPLAVETDARGKRIVRDEILRDVLVKDPRAARLILVNRRDVAPDQVLVLLARHWHLLPCRDRGHRPGYCLPAPPVLPASRLAWVLVARTGAVSICTPTRSQRTSEGAAWSRPVLPTLCVRVFIVPSSWRRMTAVKWPEGRHG